MRFLVFFGLFAFISFIVSTLSANCSFSWWGSLICMTSFTCGFWLALVKYTSENAAMLKTHRCANHILQGLSTIKAFTHQMWFKQMYNWWNVAHQTWFFGWLKCDIILFALCLIFANFWQQQKLTNQSWSSLLLAWRHPRWRVGCVPATRALHKC